MTPAPQPRLSVWRCLAIALYPPVIGGFIGQPLAWLGITPTRADGAVTLPLGFVLLVTIICMGTTLCFAKSLLHWRWRDFLGSEPPRRIASLGAIVGALGTAAFVSGAAVYAQTWGAPPPPELRFDSLSTALLGTGLAAPALEEPVYRGCVLPLLLERFGPRVSVAFSSALFAFVHQDFSLIGFGGRVLVGCGLGWVFLRTRSVVPCIAAHAAWNLGMLGLGAWPVEDAPAAFAAGGAAAALLSARLLRR